MPIWGVLSVRRKNGKPLSPQSAGCIIRLCPFEFYQEQEKNTNNDVITRSFGKITLLRRGKRLHRPRHVPPEGAHRREPHLIHSGHFTEIWHISRCTAHQGEPFLRYCVQRRRAPYIGGREVLTSPLLSATSCCEVKCEADSAYQDRIDTEKGEPVSRLPLLFRSLSHSCLLPPMLSGLSQNPVSART